MTHFSNINSFFIILLNSSEGLKNRILLKMDLRYSSFIYYVHNIGEECLGSTFDKVSFFHPLALYLNIFLRLLG